MDRTELIANVAKDLLVAAIQQKELPPKLPVSASPEEHARKLGKAFETLFAMVGDTINSAPSGAKGRKP